MTAGSPRASPEGLASTSRSQSPATSASLAERPSDSDTSSSAIDQRHSPGLTVYRSGSDATGAAGGVSGVGCTVVEVVLAADGSVPVSAVVVVEDVVGTASSPRGLITASPSCGDLSDSLAVTSAAASTAGGGASGAGAAARGTARPG